jgi:tetratricopeptide (TPR) repeat protein
MRIASSHPEPEPIGESRQTSAVKIEMPDLVLESEEPDLSTPSVPEEISLETFGIPAAGITEEPEVGILHGEKPFDEIITEVDIFSRYGLVHEAQKLLEGLKTRFPENIDVHLRLKALYMDTDERELAVMECLILSELYRRNGDDISSEHMLKEAHGINPEDPRLAERDLSRFIEPAPPAAPAAGGFGEAVSGAEPDIGDYEEEIAEADFYARQGLTTEAVKILEKLQKLFPENKDVIERLHALGRIPSLSDIEEMTGSVESSDTFDIPELPETPGEFNIPETVGPSEGFPVSGDIEQAESSELQGDTGMFGELELEEQIPPDIQTAPKGAEEPPLKAGSEEAAVTEEPLAEAPEESKESAFEDFSFSDADLVEAQEMPEPSLDNDVLEIFQEFKKGLEKELGDDDAETHYNLGIAYKEMGLVDDAIKEFQTSKVDPKRFLQSSTMLGVCYMDKGLHTLAIDVLKKAVESLKDKDESYWALSYELAEAYEKNQDLKEAVALYTSIYGWNAKFRDISDKMSLLPSPAPTAAENGKAKDKEKPKERKDRVSYL